MALLAVRWPKPAFFAAAIADAESANRGGSLPRHAHAPAAARRTAEPVTDPS
jgi:hypothetical protein